MFPSFVLFGREMSMYAIAAVAGLLTAGFYFTKCIKKRGLDDIDATIFLLWVAVGIFFGGHILYALTHLDKFGYFLKIRNFEGFKTVTGVIFGGSVFYGGLFGGIVAGLITVKAKKLDLATYADISASAAPLFHFFGRIGCFLSGCCYGIESHFGFAAQNNPYVPEVNGVTRFPVQLVEAGFNLVLFIVFYRLLKSGKCRGRLFILYLLSYSVIRFSLEFLRGDAVRGFVFGLSTSQFISAIIFVFSCFYLLGAKIQRKNG